MTAGPPPAIEVRRAVERARTVTASGVSWHSFAFGSHWDPANTGFGPLLAHNEEHLDAGAGYELHPHREVEIVTWVVSGSLVHRDDAGHRAVVGPGTVQRLSAGTGVVHSERAGADGPAHFVQMWLTPDERGLAPSHAQLAVDPARLRGSLLSIASGLDGPGGPSTLPIHARARLSAARLAVGDRVEVPDAEHVHVFVIRGALTGQIAGMAHTVHTGDAIRLTRAGAQHLDAVEPAELLVWETAAEPAA